MSDFNKALEADHTADVTKSIISFVSEAEDTSAMSRELIEAVITQFDADCFLDSASDVANYGISGGFGGWTYYHETEEFYEQNKTLIINWLEEFKNEIGYQSVSDFLLNCNTMKTQEFDADDIEAFLGDDGKDLDCYTNFANAMSWIAASEVCHLYERIAEHERECAEQDED